MDVEEVSRGLKIEDDRWFADILHLVRCARLLDRAGHFGRRNFWNSRSPSRNDASIAGIKSATGSALP